MHNYRRNSIDADDSDDESSSIQYEGNRWSLNEQNRGLMRLGTDNSSDQSEFNDIRIDLRGGGGAAAASGLSNNRTYFGNQYRTETDQRSQGSVPSRISRYAEYPQVRPTNPIYSSQSTLRTQGSNPQAAVSASSKSSATLVNRRQKFDPQAPRRPSDWRWLAILCIILFFPLGLFAFAFATKAQRRFRDGFVMESHQLNKRALILSVLSILCGIALIIGLLFGFDAWPRTNG